VGHEVLIGGEGFPALENAERLDSEFYFSQVLLAVFIGEGFFALGADEFKLVQKLGKELAILSISDSFYIGFSIVAFRVRTFLQVYDAGLTIVKAALFTFAWILNNEIANVADKIDVFFLEMFLGQFQVDICAFV
jgi:hypothetical protein